MTVAQKTFCLVGKSVSSKDNIIMQEQKQSQMDTIIFCMILFSSPATKKSPKTYIMSGKTPGIVGVPSEIQLHFFF